MPRLAFPAFIVALFVVSAWAGTAMACACCTEPGARFTAARPVDGFVGEVLASIAPIPTAHLYRDARDWDDAVVGLANPNRSTRYQVSLSRADGAWVFSFRDDKGAAGRLTVRANDTVETFAVDTAPDGRDRGPDGHGPELYKEWRLRGPVTGDGMFALRTRALNHATIILHGRGLGCTDAGQFTNWTLDVAGPTARYRFFGPLRAIGN